MRFLVAMLAVLALAAPASAQMSHCAQLPEKAQVNVGGSEQSIPTQLTASGLSCPRGFQLQGSGNATRCVQKTAGKSEAREPKRDCYAGLQLGPVRSVSGVARPTMQCPAKPSMDTIIAVRGRNAGWQDISLTAPLSASVTLTHLKASGGRVPAAEDPILNDCFPHDCRLVKLTTRGATPPRLELTLATPGNVSTTAVTVTTEASCPAR